MLCLRGELPEKRVSVSQLPRVYPFSWVCLVGLFFIAYGVMANGALAGVPLGIILMAAGASIVWLINKTAPYKWVEERKIYPPR